MQRYEAETWIERPADEVWIYAADILRHPDWMSVADARILRGDGTQLGARGRERLIVGLLKWDVEFEVVEAEPGRRITWRAVDDPRLEFEVALGLAPERPARTKATYRATIALRGRWRILAPLLALEGPSGVRRELRRLKDNVESRASVGVAS